MRKTLISIGLAAGAGLAVWNGPVHAAGTPGNAGIYGDLCRAQTLNRELSEGIPRHLLTAISLAESGRYDELRRAKIAWPWTINVGGKGMFFATKAEAIAAVEDFQIRGEKSIDVGCMQINLRYHPGAFANLNDAFNPAKNVAYAAQFLNALYGTAKTWPQAAALYHSSNPKFYLPYQQKVVRLWREVRAETGSQVEIAARPPVTTTLSSKPTVKPKRLSRLLKPNIDRLRTAALNDTFRARKEKARAVNFAEKRTRGLADWRRARSNPRLLAQLAAKRQAGRDRKRRARTHRDRADFTVKRRAQLAAWRTRRAVQRVVRVSRPRTVY